MYVTYPLAIATDELWLFTEYRDTGEVDCFRLGVDTRTGQYGAFAPECVDTAALIPVLRTQGEPVPGFVWATTGDLERNPAFPGHHDTTRHSER